MNRQAAAERALHDQTNILPRGQLMVVFAGLAISLLIAFIDQDGISVTLPTIADDLNAQDSISWAGTASLIANTMFTVLYGRLSDIFGRKIIYLSALGLFSIADLVCGFAQNPAMFYVFRGIAGIGGGGINSMALIIMSDIVTLQERGKYQGFIGAAIGLAILIGPFIAAGFSMNATWRGFFWMLTPLLASSMIPAYFFIPNSTPKGNFRENLKKIDYYGVIASSIAVIFILLPISGGGAYFEWKSPMIISMLTIGACSFVAFIFIEWKVASLPMLPVSLFKSKVLCALFLQAFFMGAVFQCTIYYLPLYFQNARGYSPIISAALTAPMVLLESIMSILSGQYISRTQRYGEVIWLGFGMWTLGAGLMLLFDRDIHPAAIAVIHGIAGFGTGLTFQPTVIAFQAHSTKAERAVVISNRNFFRCMGGACGLAIAAAILQATLRSNLPPGYLNLASSSYSLPPKAIVADADWEQILTAYAKASRGVFILQVPLVGVCLLCCMFIRDRGLEGPKDPIEEEEAAKQKPQDQEKEQPVSDPSSPERGFDTESAGGKRASNTDLDASPPGPPSNVETSAK